MAEKIKVGIIGIGFMGSTHFRIYRDHPMAEIYAIADIDEPKIRGDWSKIIGNIGNEDNSQPVNLANIKCYNDAFELIKDPEVQLVDICVPTYLHKKYITAALNEGKHVFCEKPIALDTSEANEILSLSRTCNNKLMIGMCIRFWPEYRHAYQFVKTGKIGEIKSATFKRVSPSISGISWENWFMKEKLSGGALLDLHLHDTDAIRYFFGKPLRVTSFGMKGFRSDHGFDHVFTHYDLGNETLVFSEGSWAPAGSTPFEMSFLIVGDKGTIRLSESGYKIFYENGTVETPAPAKAGLPTGWHVELDYLLRCIQQNTDPVEYLTVEEAVESMAIIEAERKSIIEQRTIEINYKKSKI